MRNVRISPKLERLLKDLNGDASDDPVRTSFRIGQAARETLGRLAARSGASMKDEIDLIALDLFHEHEGLQDLLNEFLLRSPVDSDAVRRTQATSVIAKELIERKARDLGIHRDQVLQQAILFRSAMEQYSTSGEEHVELAYGEVRHVADLARAASSRVKSLLGRSHFVAIEFRQLAEELHDLAQELDPSV